MTRDPNIRALTRGLRVLEAFNRGGSLTQIEVATITGLPYPTVRRILMTLIDAGFVEILPVSERYSLTSRSLMLSAGFQDRAMLVGRFRDGMDQLCKQVNWPISLAVPVGDKMVVRYSTHSSTSLTFTVYQPGFATPIVNSAAGVAYLAFQPRDRREALIAGFELSRVERESLDMRIAQTLGQGYAGYERTPFNPTPGKVSTIALPVRHDDEIVAAMALSVFARVMSTEEAAARFVTALRGLVES